MPRWPLPASPLTFGVGLLVSGTAQTMAKLLVGRVPQGAGSGLLVVTTSG